MMKEVQNYQDGLPYTLCTTAQLQDSYKYQHTCRPWMHTIKGPHKCQTYLQYTQAMMQMPKLHDLAVPAIWRKSWEVAGIKHLLEKKRRKSTFLISMPLALWTAVARNILICRDLWLKPDLLKSNQSIKLIIYDKTYNQAIKTRLRAIIK